MCLTRASPVAVAWWRDEDLHDYAFHAEPIKRGLVIAGLAILSAFPIFALGYLGFHELVCMSASERIWAFFARHHRS